MKKEYSTDELKRKPSCLMCVGLNKYSMTCCTIYDKEQVKNVCWCSRKKANGFCYGSSGKCDQPAELVPDVLLKLKNNKWVSWGRPEHFSHKRFSVFKTDFPVCDRYKRKTLYTDIISWIKKHILDWDI